MWSRNGMGRMGLRWSIVAALALLTAGCFQPMYGTAPVAGGAPNVREALAAIEIAPIDAPKGGAEARLAVEIQDALRFALQGGGGAAPPTHRLVVRMVLRTTPITVDVTSGRAEVEVTGIDATYQLLSLATGKPVATGQTFSRVTSDVPGQQQRCARGRAQRDAEERAARVIADHIRLRLASVVIAGS